MFDAISAATNAGLDPSLAAYMPRFVQIESGGNPNAQTGKYSGYLQMGPDEAAKYGGNGLANGAAMYADRANWFQNKYGRAPTPTELYLANQQGQGGIAAHLANPDAPAWQNMANTAEGRQKGEAWAKQAIWGNVPTDVRKQFPGGVDNLTSSQFMNLWRNKVEGTSGQPPAMQAAFADNRKQNMGFLDQAFAQNNQTANDANQYAYAPQYDQNAGLFDRLRQGGPGALFGGFGRDSGTGAPGGIFAGKDGRPGYDLGTHLQRAALFGLAANNPSALGALGAVNGENAKKWVQIGTDPYGNPKYGFVDERNGTVMPAGGVAGGAGGASGSQNNDANDPIAAALKTGLTGEDLLKQPGIPEQTKAWVRGIANGTQAYNEAAMMRTPAGRMAATLIPQYEPGADYVGRAAGVRDWATKSAETTRRAEQTALHGGELVDKFKALNNGDIPAWNALKNEIKSGVGYGEPLAAQSNITALANEMGALVRGNGGSDAAFKEWSQTFPVNGSPDQQRAAMGNFVQLYKDSVSALEQKRLMAIGPNQVKQKGPLLSARAQDAISKMEAYANSNNSRASELPKGVTSIKVVE